MHYFWQLIVCCCNCDSALTSISVSIYNVFCFDKAPTCRLIDLKTGEGPLPPPSQPSSSPYEHLKNTQSLSALALSAYFCFLIISNAKLSKVDEFKCQSILSFLHSIFSLPGKMAAVAADVAVLKLSFFGVLCSLWKCTRIHKAYFISISSSIWVLAVVIVDDINIFVIRQNILSFKWISITKKSIFKTKLSKRKLV